MVFDEFIPLKEKPIRVLVTIYVLLFMDSYFQWWALAELYGMHCACASIRYVCGCGRPVAPILISAQTRALPLGAGHVYMVHARATHIRMPKFVGVRIHVTCAYTVTLHTTN